MNLISLIEKTIYLSSIIKQRNTNTNDPIFMLWGSPAQKKCKRVDGSKHLILTAPHPSPLSAYRGFFGCNHFIKCNEYLKAQGKTTIDWQIPLNI